MSLNRLLDDPELQMLIGRVQKAYGSDVVIGAMADAIAAIAREQRAQIKTGALPDADSLPVMRVALRRELEALMREQ